MKGAVLCVDIGGTSTKAGLVDEAGGLHFSRAIPTVPDCESYFASLAGLIGKVHDDAASVNGLGVAVAGFLSPSRDRLVYNPNLGWLEEFPLRERLARRFSWPVELEIDSNAACMAEQRFGCGRDSRRFLCVTAGTGLGVGMAVGGEPLRFAYGCLGDIGHVIVQPGGARCACGGRGCAEALLSAPALGQRFAERSGRSAACSLRDVIDAAHASDPLAATVLREAGEFLGLAIASMASILFPDRIAIAGGLSAAGDFVMKPAEDAFRRSAGTLAQAGVGFERATLGASATLIGAGWPFWQERKSVKEVANYGESVSR